MVLGIADHDSNIVAIPLYALGLLAVECLSHLMSQIRKAQSQRLGGGQDVQLDFLLPSLEGIRDVKNPLVFTQRLLQLL